MSKLKTTIATFAEQKKRLNRYEDELEICVRRLRCKMRQIGMLLVDTAQFCEAFEVERNTIVDKVEALEAIKAIHDDESLDEVDRDNAVFEVLEGLK